MLHTLSQRPQSPSPVSRAGLLQWICAGIVLLGSLVPGRAAAPTLGPRIQFANPTYDFGQVLGGERVLHEFFFTNTGDARLEITNVHTSCGCAVAGKWTRQVEPGQAGSIPLELLTVNLSGAVDKTIEVRGNLTNPPVTSLQITGKVWWPIEISPVAATLSLFAHAKSNPPAFVRIVNQQKVPLTLAAPACGNPRIVPRLHTVKEGQEYRLEVQVEPPPNPGNVFGQVTIKTSATNMAELRIPVFALVQDEVIALPSPLAIPARLTGPSVRQTISIRSFWDQPLVLGEASLADPRIALRMDEMQPGKFFAFTLTFPEGYTLPPSQRIDLKVKTNHPRYPLITVPIMPSSRPAASATAPRVPGAPVSPLAPRS